MKNPVHSAYPEPICGKVGIAPGATTPSNGPRVEVQIGPLRGDHDSSRLRCLDVVAVAESGLKCNNAY